MRGFSEICIVKNSVMAERKNYLKPKTSVLDVRMEAFICLSNYMKFGSGNTAGSIEDENIVIGGDF